MKRFFLFPVTLGCFLGLVACGDGNSTNGRRITLGTTATGAPDAKGTLTTGFGWDVTLNKAVIATVGFYYFDGPPPTARYQPPKKNWSDWFIKSAYAHPGHYQAGTALGEALFGTPLTIDVLAPGSLLLPSGNGITGTYRSARLVLPQDATTDPVLEGHVAIAEGKAVLHGGTSTAPIYFKLIADYADVSTSIQNGAVDGCVLDEVLVTKAGTINVEVVPTVWLNLVDFSRIPPGAAGAPSEARDAGFSQGVTQLSAYRFTYAVSP